MENEFKPDGKLEVIHKNGQPYGIRDAGGYLMFFPKVSKIGDKTFEFESPNILDKSTTDMMNDWCRLVEQQKNDKDVWTVIPELPQYKFKNLKIENSPFETTDETTEMTVTFKYDDFEFDDKNS